MKFIFIILFLIIILAAVLYKSRYSSIHGGFDKQEFIDEKQEFIDKKQKEYEQYCNNNTKYAYVFTVAMNDIFVGYGLALAKSLKETGTKYDIICQVDKGVSLEGIKALSEYAWIVQIPEIDIQHPEIEKFIQNMYQGTRNKIFDIFVTRFYFLTFTQYDKICSLDGDIIVLENIDNIFDYDTPAGVFSHTNSSRYSKHSSVKDIYKKYKHNDKLSPKIIKKAFNGSHTVNNGLLLLKPSKKIWNKMIKIAKRIDKYELIPLKINNLDENLITLTYLDKKWTFLDSKYNFLSSLFKFIKKPKFKVIHYIGNEKPLDIPRDKYDDNKYFWKYADKVIFEYPEFKKFFTIK